MKNPFPQISNATRSLVQTNSQKKSCCFFLPGGQMTEGSREPAFQGTYTLTVERKEKSLWGGIQGLVVRRKVKGGKDWVSPNHPLKYGWGRGQGSSEDTWAMWAIRGGWIWIEKRNFLLFVRFQVYVLGVNDNVKYTLEKQVGGKQIWKTPTNSRMDKQVTIYS